MAIYLCLFPPCRLCDGNAITEANGCGYENSIFIENKLSKFSDRGRWKVFRQEGVGGKGLSGTRCTGPGGSTSLSCFQTHLVTGGDCKFRIFKESSYFSKLHNGNSLLNTALGNLNNFTLISKYFKKCVYQESFKNLIPMLERVKP
jgi:hypothetical protein